MLGDLIFPANMSEKESGALEALRHHAEEMLDLICLHQMQLPLQSIPSLKKILCKVCTFTSIVSGCKVICSFHITLLFEKSVYCIVLFIRAETNCKSNGVLCGSQRVL